AGLSDRLLRLSFDRSWPELSAVLTQVSEEEVLPLSVVRPLDDMVREVLDTVRSLDRRVGDIEEHLVTDFEESHPVSSPLIQRRHTWVPQVDLFGLKISSEGSEPSNGAE